MLKLDSHAPDFTLPRNGGGTVSLSSFAPSKVVLFFYPKDDTPGCTTEAIDFTRLAEDFAAASTTVIGISKDSVLAHDRFCAKYDLTVILASDTDGAVCDAYGTWGDKKLYGRTFLGIIRTTFLIGSDGRIVRVWPKVSVSGHADEVLAATRAL